MYSLQILHILFSSLIIVMHMTTISWHNFILTYQFFTWKSCCVTFITRRVKDDTNEWFRVVFSVVRNCNSVSSCNYIKISRSFFPWSRHVAVHEKWTCISARMGKCVSLYKQCCGAVRFQLQTYSDYFINSH